MIGANQIVKAEIDEAYANEAGICIVRRPSGGGAIFTDEGTLQYTVILPYDEKSPYNKKLPFDERSQHDNKSQHDEKSLCDGKPTYDEKQTEADPKACMREWLAEPLIETLAKLGVRASLEGRNDVTIDGKKISGLAQHVKSGYICSHGSLLFNTDLEKLARVLTVDKEKITSKAIASVNARVTKISEHIDITKYTTETTGSACEKDLQVFRESFVESYCQRYNRKEFTKTQLEKIKEIMQERYCSDSWTYGREPAFTYTNKKRFPGGQVEVFLDIKGNVIRSAVIKGDFLALRPVSEIEEGLAGTPHKEEALREALHSLDIKRILGSITEDELLITLI
jgi:lipoate-protein ligase A